jgi:hypothetical protein
MERAYSPYSYFVWPFPGALPQADIVRAFGALLVFLMGIAMNAISGGPKARSIAAWGNAPGKRKEKKETRAVGPFHRPLFMRHRVRPRHMRDCSPKRFEI